MDPKDGAATAALSASIREYSLFPAIRQVLRHLQERSPQASEDSLYQRLEFQANPSLGFAAGEIDSLRFFEENGELRAQLRLNLLGLAGSGSPLPAFYKEQALSDDPIHRQFLDLFNDRLQRLLWPIWQKYRYQERFTQGARDPRSEQLFALIGLAGPSIRTSGDLDWNRLLPYLGLLGRRIQGAASLEVILRHYFRHPAMHIEQCVERRVCIPLIQRCHLGRSNHRLAQSALLGTTLHDRSGKFRLHIRDLDWNAFQRFLPTGNGHRPLAALLRFILHAPLEHDLTLHLRRDEIRPLHLYRQNGGHLGWSTWLGHEHAEGHITLAANRYA